MPYKDISELPARIRKALPKKAQQLFIKAFNSVYHKYGEEKAFRIAWAVVKKKYLKKDKKWVLKSKGLLSHYKKLSSTSGDKLKVIEFAISSPEVDSDKEVLEKTFLLSVRDSLIGMKGDLEHANALDLDLPKEWIAKIVDANYINGLVTAKAILNYQHPYIEDVWSKVLQGKLGASLELEADDNDYYIDEKGIVHYVNGNITGWALTTDPANSDAYVFRAYSS